VVVDVDLEKFFDRVNHDILIDRLSKRINDAGVIVSERQTHLAQRQPVRYW
jgi:retron-type reverse transcriptase